MDAERHLVEAHVAEKRFEGPSGHSMNCAMNCKALGHGTVWKLWKQKVILVEQGVQKDLTEFLLICLLGTPYACRLDNEWPFLLVDPMARHKVKTYSGNGSWGYEAYCGHSMYKDMASVSVGIEAINPKHNLLLFIYSAGLIRHDKFIVVGFGPRWGKAATLSAASS